MYTNTYLLYSSHTMNYIIGYRRVYSIMYIESVVCMHTTCYYYFANSVHNIHSAVWCVCICIHVRSCYSFSQPIHAYISHFKKCICIIMLLSLHSSYAYFLIRELPHDLYYRMWMCVMCAVATSNHITLYPFIQ